MFRVKDLVATYDLNPQLASRITHIVTSILGHEDAIDPLAHDLVAQEVDKRTWPRDLHLDQNRLYNRGIIDVKDECDDREIQLEEHIRKHFLALPPQVIDLINRAGEIWIPEPTTRITTEMIVQRLGSIPTKYHKEGTIIFPAREIKRVRLDPFSIEYKRRNFNGDPLSFFREHHKTYAGLGRRELFYLDESLLRTLIRHGQLDQAIPHTRQRYKRWGGAQQFLLAHHERYQGLTAWELYQVDRGLYDALREKGILHDYFKKGKRGLFANFDSSSSALVHFRNNYETYQGLSLTQLHRDHRAIYDALTREKRLHFAIPKGINRKYRGFDSPAAFYTANKKRYEGITREELRVVDSGLRDALYRHGQIDVVPKQPRHNPNILTLEEVTQIIDAHSESNGKTTLAMQITGRARHTIIKYWRAAGFKVRSVRNKLDENDINIIRSAYQKYDGNATRAAHDLGYSRRSISRVWKQKTKI